MTNLQLLIDRYKSLTLDTDQIMEILKITNRGTFHNAISRGRIPFRTFKATKGSERIANIKDVAAWMDTADRD